MVLIFTSGVKMAGDKGTDNSRFLRSSGVILVALTFGNTYRVIRKGASLEIRMLDCWDGEKRGKDVDIRKYIRIKNVFKLV